MAQLQILSLKDELCEKAISLFESKFGSRPETVACGPGRVNLIGEHTDYQEGFVFPAALDRKTVVALTLNNSGTYHIVSDDLKKEEFWDSTSPPAVAPEKPEWSSYILGSIRIFCQVAKVEFPKGFNLLCITTVPIGGGLSSSAALEVATCTAMEKATNVILDPLVKAKDVCQKCEHDWAKVPCGLMDQAISVMGKEGYAMMFDCKSLVSKFAPIPSFVSILVVNSGVSHSLVSGEYSLRRNSCARAVEIIQKKNKSIHSLRDVDLKMLEASHADFNVDPKMTDSEDAIAWIRATHVVNENIRSISFADALEKGDLKKAGEIMYEGHNSLHLNYDVTVLETDSIVSIARQIDGVYGARMTGGGFGGSVCILVESTKAEIIKEQIMKKYLPIFEERKQNQTSSVHYNYPLAFIAKASQGAVVYQH